LQALGALKSITQTVLRIHYFLILFAAIRIAHALPGMNINRDITAVADNYHSLVEAGFNVWFSDCFLGPTIRICGSGNSPKEDPRYLVWLSFETPRRKVSAFKINVTQGARA
jgi:hypothetical protein